MEGKAESRNEPIVQPKKFDPRDPVGDDHISCFRFPDIFDVGFAGDDDEDDGKGGELGLRRVEGGREEGRMGLTLDLTKQSTLRRT